MESLFAIQNEKGKFCVLGIQNAYTTYGRAFAPIKEVVKGRNYYINRHNMNLSKNEKPLESVSCETLRYKVVELVKKEL